VNLATIVSLIGATHSRSGLRVRSELDRGHYPSGVAVTDAQMAAEAARTVLPEGALKKTVSTLPVYPAQAASRGTEGWVEVEFTVASDGSTRDAVVLDASPEGVFDSAVLHAVRHWRYEPRIVAGKPIDQRVKARLRFKLAGG